MDGQDIAVFVKKHPLGVVCAGIALLLFGATYVRSGSVGDLELRLEEVTREGEKLKNNLKYAARLEEHLLVVQRAVREIDERAINPGSLATNLQYFYRLDAELDNLRLIDLRQGTPEVSRTPTQYLAVPYTISVEGTYRGVLEFVRRLETGSRYVKFLSSNLAPSRTAEAEVGGESTDPLLVLSLNLHLLGRS